MPATNASLATVAAAGGYTFIGSSDDQVRHRAGQDHRHQPADLQQHADGLPEQRRHLRQGERLVPAVLRAVSVVLVQGPAAQAQPPNVSGCGDATISGHLRHRPDDRDPERPHRHGRRHPRPGRGRHARPHRRQLRARRARPLNAFADHDPPPGTTRGLCNNIAATATARSTPRSSPCSTRSPSTTTTAATRSAADGQRHDRAEASAAPSARTAAARRSTASSRTTQYDPRLAFRSPPHFLDPVKSAWHVLRYTEQ